ncbi:MAG: 30S ribosomal protein S1 [Thermodesulfobacteriota bacterium]|nr:30S ribosomal protein S1 [Thermodesulfobacteriota bacterium]
MNDENFEIDDELENEDFAAMLEESMGGATRLELGQKTEAEILQIGKDWVFLDIGQKGEGVLDVRELQDDSGELTVEVGDSISAYFMSRTGGEMRFTTRIGAGSSGTAQLEEAWRNGIPVDGRVEKEIKGGYEITLPGGVRAFCPYSQIALRRQENPEEVIGQSFPVKISQFSEQGRNVVVSRRALLEEERRAQSEELKKTLKEGDRVSGEVTSICDFGAFIEIGGVEGLLPISEVSYSRVEDLSEVLHVGQQLELVVKRIDWAENKFAFSLRDTLVDPWSTATDNFPIGSGHTGKVSRLAQFGAFVTLEEGLDGLVHISRLGEGKRINHPREVLSVGQELSVVVEKIDVEQRRISLVPVGAEDVGTEKSWTDKPVSSGFGSFGDLLKGSQAKSGQKGNKQR